MTPTPEQIAASLTPAQVRAELRQAIAAFTLAYQEPDRDTETQDDADQITARWFRKWMATGYPTEYEHSEHSGDCTRQSWSCMRCIADEILASVDASLAALDKGAGE